MVPPHSDDVLLDGQGQAPRTASSRSASFMGVVSTWALRGFASDGGRYEQTCVAAALSGHCDSPMGDGYAA